MYTPIININPINNRLEVLDENKKLFKKPVIN